jgi:hypothetical protein
LHVAGSKEGEARQSVKDQSPTLVMVAFMSRYLVEGIVITIIVFSLGLLMGKP